MKWLNFDEYECRNFFREILAQCDTEDEIDVLELKLQRVLESIVEECMEEIEGEY